MICSVCGKEHTLVKVDHGDMDNPHDKPLFTCFKCAGKLEPRLHNESITAETDAIITAVEERVVAPIVRALSFAGLMQVAADSDCSNDDIAQDAAIFQRRFMGIPEPGIQSDPPKDEQAEVGDKYIKANGQGWVRHDGGWVVHFLKEPDDE